MFKDPDTKHVFEESNYANLYKRIILYRAQNNLEPIENLNIIVENYICGLPENANKCCDREMQRGLWEYVKGGVALVKSLMYQDFASQAVADKRAKQCVGCKFNIFPDKGNFLTWSDNIAIHTVGERKSKEHEKLGNCSVCTCNLKSKVFYKGKLPKVSHEQMEKFKEVNCWQIPMIDKD